MQQQHKSNKIFSRGASFGMMTGTAKKTSRGFSDSDYYYYYYDSSSDESSDTEVDSEIGYGSGHSENSIFSSDEEGLFRHNPFRRRSFTKRVRRKSSGRKEIESDNANETTFVRSSGKDCGTPTKGVAKKVCGEEKIELSKVQVLGLENRDLIQNTAHDKEPNQHKHALSRTKTVLQSVDHTAKRYSWHQFNVSDITKSSGVPSPLPLLEKRKSWTDSGVSLSKTDSTVSSLAGRSYRSSSRGSRNSWYICSENKMVQQNFTVEDKHTPYCESSQSTASCEQTCVKTENSTTRNSLPGERKSFRSMSADSPSSSCAVTGNKESCDHFSGKAYHRILQYNLADNLFQTHLDQCKTKDEEEAVDSGLSRENSLEAHSCESRGASNDSASCYSSNSNSSTPRSRSGQHVIHDQQDVLIRSDCAQHPVTNRSKFESPILNSAGELITLVNSKRFSGQRISFDDAQYTPKEKEILQQLFKNAEVAKTENDNVSSCHSKIGSERSQFALPDHLNYPLCMYYTTGAAKATKGRSFLKGLKKLKETMKLRKATKPAPAEKPAEDQTSDKDQKSLDALSISVKRNEGAAAKGRRFIRRMLTRSSGRSLKFQREPLPDDDESPGAFRRSRSGSTRSIPESLRNMWGRARSRSVENIRAAIDRNCKMTTRLTRTNSTHSLFGRKRSGSTDQLPSFGQERRSALGGRRSESMRSLSAVGGFDIAVRLLSSNGHRCRNTQDQSVNSEFNSYFPPCPGQVPRIGRRSSVVSRESVPNFYGLQGRLMQGGCQDEYCTDSRCYRYTCYCDDCDGCGDDDRCSLCDEDGCYNHNTNSECDDGFVHGDFAVIGQSPSLYGGMSRCNRDEMVIAPLNMTVTQERIAERRVLSQPNRERLDTYV